MEIAGETSTAIGVIGTGNMGSALVKGWLRAEPADGGSGPSLMVWDRLDASIERLFEEFRSSARVSTSPHGRLLAAGSLEDLVGMTDVVVLVVKPKDARELLGDLGRLIRKEQTVVSAMAGLTLERLREALGPGPALFRIMPNLAVEVGAGAVAVAVEPRVAPDGLEALLALLQPLGSVEVVTEELFDVVTAVAGSSPAFFAVAIEALEDGAVAAGLSRDAARTVVRQAALRAAARLPGRPDAPGDSRPSSDRRVEADPSVIKLLEEREVRLAFRQAVEAAMEQSRRMRKDG
jgi:pyrroline-5-carboxylate reductase